MSEVQLKLTADVDAAQREVGKFRKEYAQLVGDITKPLRKINTFKELESSLEGTEKSMRSARDKVRELADELARTERPSRQLTESYRDAVSELRKLDRAQGQQANQLARTRGELGAMGVQTRNLTAEQARLQTQLNATMQAGRADAALQAASDRLGLTRVRELRASLISLDADYRRVTQSARLSATERAAVEMQYQAQLRTTRRELNELTGEMASFGGEGSGGGAVLLSRAASLAATLYALKRVSDGYFEINDDLKNIEARLWNAVNGQEEYNHAQARLKEIAKETGKPLREQMELFIATVGPLQEVGFTANEVLTTVQALTLGLVASGTEGDQAAAMMNQFSKAMQLGTLRGDAFNSFMENNRVAAEALRRGLRDSNGELGVTTQELRRMAEAGELTGSKVLPALASQIDFLTGKVKEMPDEMRDARIRMDDGFRQLVRSFDNLTGFSDESTRSMLKFADAIDAVADPSLSLFQRSVKFNREFFEALPDAPGPLGGWLNRFVQGLLDLVDTQEEVLEESQRLADEARQQTDAQYKAERDARQASIADLVADQKKKLDLTKEYLREQSRLESKANSEVEKVRNKRLEIEDRYQKALAGLSGTGKPSYGAAQSLMVGARQALAVKDYKEAQRQASAALKMLQDLAAAGENTYGFAGFIKQLQGIELAANDLEQSEADKKLSDIKGEIKSLKEQVKDLEKIKIGFDMDDASLDDVRQKLLALSKDIGLLDSPEPTSKGYAEIFTDKRRQERGVIEAEVEPKGWYRDGNSFSDMPPVAAEVRPQKWYQDGNSFSDIPPAEVDAVVDLDEEAAAKTKNAVEQFAESLQKALVLEVQPQWYPVRGLQPIADSAPGFARGGPIRGPGTGTSDSILMWGSNGEFMMRERAVKHYGLDFMNKLNQGRIPRFAGGGAIADVPRHIPFIPPMPDTAPAGMAGGTPVNLHFGGESFEMRATQDVISALHRAVRTQRLRRK